VRSEGCIAALLVALAVTSCDEKNEPQAPERFAAVKKKPQVQASTFCEKQWAAKEKPFAMPALKAWGSKAEKQAGWTWLNLWATWCKPCVEEMGLLSRWNEALQRERVPVSFELLSIDEEGADLDGWLKQKTMPGHVSWIRSQEDFTGLLGAMGLDKNAAIPIHALVDPAGGLRCVRVGSIHQENWGAVRALVGNE
jgi:thiol-disulfide isomerase/thioredoxin